MPIDQMWSWERLKENNQGVFIWVDRFDNIDDDSLMNMTVGFALAVKKYWGKEVVAPWAQT